MIARFLRSNLIKAKPRFWHIVKPFRSVVSADFRGVGQISRLGTCHIFYASFCELRGKTVRSGRTRRNFEETDPQKNLPDSMSQPDLGALLLLYPIRSVGYWKVSDLLDYSTFTLLEISRGVQKPRTPVFLQMCLHAECTEIYLPIKDNHFSRTKIFIANFFSQHLA